MIKLSKELPVKILLCSKQKLTGKYGQRFKDIDESLKALKESDLKRNIKTSIVYLDDKSSENITGIAPISSITSRACKQYIDKLYKNLNPAYLCLIGAQDNIPFYEFENPLFDPDGDNDQLIYSDLPYACEKSHSTQMTDFVGPSRVVGRLPDIPFVNDYQYFLKVIRNSKNFKSVDRKKLNAYFALSVKLWKNSSTESITNIFNNSNKLLLSPPVNEKHSKTLLKPLLHFYNCHGALFTPEFYGQTGQSYPVCQHSSTLIDKISRGSVVSAECCYGAQMYDHKQLGQPDKSIANTYLGEGACAFMGSTTIAYGPADGQGLADLICQYFLIKIREGASLGRAFLEARQKFVKDSAEFDPYELKTLHQFILLGDPSLVPFDLPKAKSSQESIEGRRNKMTIIGKALQNSTAVFKIIAQKTSQYNKTAVNHILKELKFDKIKLKKSFAISPAKNSIATGKSASASTDSVLRVYYKATSKLNIKKISALVVRENKQRVLSYKIYESK